MFAASAKRFHAQESAQESAQEIKEEGSAALQLLPPGQRVVLHRLTNKTELNGSAGVVIGWEPSIGHYNVVMDQVGLEENDGLYVKPEKVTREEEAEEAAPAAAAGPGGAPDEAAAEHVGEEDESPPSHPLALTDAPDPPSHDEVVLKLKKTAPYTRALQADPNAVVTTLRKTNLLNGKPSLGRIGYLLVDPDGGRKR